MTIQQKQTSVSVVSLFCGEIKILFDYDITTFFILICGDNGIYHPAILKPVTDTNASLKYLDIRHRHMQNISQIIIQIPV